MATANYIQAVLEKTGVFPAGKVQEAAEGIAQGSLSPGEAAVQAGLLEKDFFEALAGVLRMPFLRLKDQEIAPEILSRLPTKAVFQYQVIPVCLENDTLRVAVSDPFTAGLIDSLRLAAGCRVKLALSPSEDIGDAARKFYGVGAETVDRMMLDNRYEELADEQIAKSDLSELDQEASIVKFVNQIIREADRQGATDIHFEPMESRLRIRYRVDGVLHETPVPVQLIRFQAAIISRIKVMANLDIAEKRLPMDGRIGLRVEGRNIDIRVSTMPTVYGESVSLRLLQSGTQLIRIEDSGMSDEDSATVRRLIHRPNGIILVTGPTGSGKSTSLFGYLQELNRTDVRIMTAENPIEYEMSGVNQVLVRPEIGLSFGRVLRSFLRQDPDIIMVGEIRDLETAEIAIQASLTGHLVFSTLHTNDAAGAFTRLVDMGVEPYLVASAVEGVIAQRLVRRLCGRCRKCVPLPEADILADMRFPVDKLEKPEVYEPGSCDHCRNMGFRGRLGIFEILPVSERIQSLVTGRHNASEIKQQALREGMHTLRDDGWNKVANGVTTIEEVLRATEENEG
jgi:type II secretory ATPase GspE/PulE/Tfp pilus assembly ATPase PilB-like protein